MLAAGLDLFGTQGFNATTVEDVCRRAGVSTRNFYEEFDDRLALLAAVGEQVAAGAFAAWAAAGGMAPAGSSAGVVAERLRARLAALVHALVDDPRVARLAFVECVGIDPSHEALRRQALGLFSDWLATYMRGHLTDAGVAPARHRAITVGLVGAVHELMADWTLRPPDERPTVDELIYEVADFVAPLLRLPPPAPID